MNNSRALAPWIKHFLLEYLPTDRNFTRNTQHSYRDALRLLVIFASTSLRKKPDELLVDDLGTDLVRRFMRHIEEKRKDSVSTRNQRLAAVRTLAAFIHRREKPRLRNMLPLSGGRDYRLTMRFWLLGTAKRCFTSTSYASAQWGTTQRLLR